MFERIRFYCALAIAFKILLRRHFYIELQRPLKWLISFLDYNKIFLGHFEIIIVAM